MRVMTVAVWCLLLVGCGAEPPSVATGTTATITAPQPPPAAVMDHDDAYQVGVGIPPGIWHTDGPRTRRGVNVEVTAAPCHWQRGATDSVIASGNEFGPVDVEIKPADGVFGTTGCRPWRLKG